MDKSFNRMATKDGKEKKRKQKRRWRDDFKSYMGTAAWTRIARDRREWKCYEKGFVQRLDEL